VSYQATFYHFLQPHLFARRNLSQYEKGLVRNHFLIPQGVREAFQIGYPTLQAALNELPASIKRGDLTEILNERPDGVEYFFDWAHVNHEANCIIAEAIYQHIMADLK